MLLSVGTALPPASAALQPRRFTEKSLCQIALCRKHNIVDWVCLIVVLSGSAEHLTIPVGNKANIVITTTQTCLPIYLLSLGSSEEKKGVKRCEVGVTMTNQTSSILPSFFFFLCCFVAKPASAEVKSALEA